MTQPHKRLERNPVLFEDHKIMFRNFKGAGNEYNRQGNRHFSLVLEENEAKAMMEDGWNVRVLDKRLEEGDIPKYIIEVVVKYGKYPPKIVMITSRGRTLLTEDLVEMLDAVDVESVDLTFLPYNWSIPKKDGSVDAGVKPYLKTMYITIREDPLDLKYAGMDDASGYVPDWDQQ